MSVRRVALSVLIAALMLVFMSATVTAGNEGGGDGYGTQPGFEVATEKTDCSGHGSFGFFGKDWNLGNEQSGHYLGGSYPGPGADGTQTGINNSSLCGNPQNN